MTNVEVPTRAAPPHSTIPRAAGNPRLSFAQERIWFTEQLSPGTAAYVVHTTVRLRGPFDVDLLRAALDATAARHDSLRMRFTESADGEPVVTVLPEVTVPVTVTAAPDTDAAHALVADSVHTPFDLAVAPLLRVLVVRLADTEHLLHLAMHHIVSDGWSLDLLLGEIAAGYATLRDGGDPPAPPATRYVDYAGWQRDRLDGPPTGDGFTHWTRALAGVPPLELPTDRPRPAVQSYAGATHRFTVDADLTDGLRRLGRAHRATLYMTLLTGLQAVLFRYSGQRDFAVGSPVAGRVVPELEHLVGLFVNTLALRADLSPDPATAAEPGFATLLRRNRGTVVRALAHQEIPFERLVKELNVTRDVARAPVFQVLFTLQNYARGGDRWPAGLHAEPVGTDAASARFDLALYVGESADGLRGTFVYHTDLFDAATVAGLAESFRTLLRAAVAEPDRPVADLDLLGPAGRDRMLALAGDRAGPPPPDAGVTGAAVTLADLIDPYVAASPDAPAVVCGTDRIGYRELDRRANRLAHWLRARGVGPDRLVGVLLEQSVELAVTLLGVLRAGGAYLPLDPEQPAARLGLMLADARPTVLLTGTGLRDRLPAGTAATCLDEITAEVHAQPDDRPATGVRDGHLAYVIYTSGSTGTPKGVAVPHRPVLRYLDGVADRFAVAPAARYGLLQSMSFDFAVTVFYLALATGGAVHLLPRRGTGAELATRLRDERIDYLKITPSHLAALTADCAPDDLLPARALILGGEASDLERIAPLAAGPTRVFNHYGPTEATVGAATYRVPADGPDVGPVPTGRPLPYASVHVLDERMRQVPVGMPGELYLGGDRLARGYLRRPGLTAERFVPDPYGPPGARLYRTGDLARWRADGELIFLGRRDHQVKIRGYRVELGEVEAALRDCPGVRQAAVLLRDDRLVAYLEAEPDPDGPDPARWRHLLAGRLPEHMVPTRWVVLDRLPLQEHGKVDRRALPEPTDDGPTGERVPPVGPVERLVADVWRAVLGVPEVGVTDDFFDLGGHSLLATRVVARLRRELPAVVDGTPPPVSVMDLFRHRTVRELADLVGGPDAGRAGLLHELTPPVPAADRVATLLCVPYGGGSAVVYQPLADALPAGYRLLSVAVPGHDIGLADEPAPIADVAADVVAEVLGRVTGPLIVYGHCGPGGALAVEVARRLEAAGRDLLAVYLGAVFPFARPADGPLGPLLRLRLAERLRSDRIYRTWLQAQGTAVGSLAPDEVRFLVRAMRHDARVSEDYFTTLLRQRVTPLRAPVVSVVGERDRSTDYHEERYREWHFLSGRTALAVIDEGGHYFLKYRAAELAEIVTGVHQRLDAPPRPVPAGSPATPPPWQLAAVSRTDGPPTADAPGPTDGGARTPPPSLRRFGLVAAGQVVSGLGTALTTFAIPLWIYTQTGSLARFALFAVLGLLPGLLVAPLAGALIDRTSRRRVLLAAGLAAGSANAVLAALVFTDRVQVWHFYPLVGWLSVALAFQRLAFVSAVPQLVPKRFLGHANGLTQTAVGLTQFTVPLLAVALLETIGLRGILLVDVASYLFAVGVLTVVRFPRTLAMQRREGIGTEIVAGLRYALRRREFRAMLAFFAALNFFLFPVLFLLSPLVLGFADLTDVSRVALTGGIGAATGGLVMLLWGGPRHRRMRAVLLGTLGIAVAAVVTGLRPNLLLIGAGAFGMYLALGIVNGVYQTIIQTKVPARVHGRVFAVNQMVAQSTLPLGWGLVAPFAARVVEPTLLPDGALAGTVGAVLGVGPGRGHGLLYVLFGVCIALTALVSLATPTLARFDDEVPDAPPDDLVGIEERRARTADAVDRRTPVGVATAGRTR
ncbi:non-ribosomal peptide synthetase/MFS transporter [Micromonospora sp. HUAS LYJ1]|uniref:non-ribosomal peptide synthetase/MFS transporter n=1 Tax=Micromonospora sp. HUAS LYJ1 TaxID=3061626 RepID=UPI0026727AE3|nr:non-ribosomal peptide synthetase/MFS transporter [Micromonospora sp. HUAS LYJ1]WKU06831.1 amino acid adenylation domain-containing protein [Micromonospora sp. HUAS LYJ1]